MSTKKFKTNSLVLYKQRPARIRQTGSKKISIELDDGNFVNVRPKDILYLHPGPLNNFSSLIPLTGDIETAWELLAGETCSLEELSELTYDEFTPA